MKRISKILKECVTVAVIAAMVFTCMPAALGDVTADAASTPKPSLVKSIKVETKGSTGILVLWSKVPKNVKGYTVYRDSKPVRDLGPNTLRYTDTGLRPNTKYSYYVKAYNIKKTKQWYNKKTKKWVTKKPAKKKCGKSRVVTTRLYGKASPKISLKTSPKPTVPVSGGGETPELQDPPKVGLQGRTILKGENFDINVTVSEGVAKNIKWECKEGNFIVNGNSRYIKVNVPKEYTGEYISLKPIVTDGNDRVWKNYSYMKWNIRPDDK